MSTSLLEEYDRWANGIAAAGTGRLIRVGRMVEWYEINEALPRERHDAKNLPSSVAVDSVARVNPLASTHCGRTVSRTQCAARLSI